MSHRIVIDEAKLRDEFEDLIDEIYWTYFYHPSNIPNYTAPETDRDRQMSYYDYLGVYLGGAK